MPNTTTKRPRPARKKETAARPQFDSLLAPDADSQRSYEREVSEVARHVTAILSSPVTPVRLIDAVTEYLRGLAGEADIYDPRAVEFLLFDYKRRQSARLLASRRERGEA